MSDKPRNDFWKFWMRPLRFFLWATVSLLVIGIVFHLCLVAVTHKGPFWEGFGTLELKTGYVGSTAILAGAFLLSVLGLAVSLFRPTRPIAVWVLRRWFFCAAALVTFIALFYAEENWRGKRAWEKTRHSLEAGGAVLNWDQFIPPPVPDEQNIFKAPKIQEWFVQVTEKINSHGWLRRLNPSNELTGLLRSPTNFPTWGTAEKIDSEADARAYLAWSDHLQPQFDLIGDALKRPYARIEGDYSQMLVLPFPNFIAIRQLSRTLAQRSHCYLILRQPDKAVGELTLIHDLRHLLLAAPSGKPMTLVGAMINVAIAGLYVEVIGDGFRLHVWRDRELAELEKQLSEMHLMIPVATAFQAESAATVRTLEIVPVDQIFGGENLLRLAPRGWVYQNMAQAAPFHYLRAEGFNSDLEFVSPRPLKKAEADFEKFLSHASPFNFIARTMIPNVVKAILTTARNQNSVNEARIACALERYKLAHGQYPDSLDALAPLFIEKIPHDVINDAQLKYRRSNDGFVLYSIGWDEKDDGGATVVLKDGRTDPASPDWVWEYSAK